jgi:hypothetical protein
VEIEFIRYVRGIAWLYGLSYRLDVQLSSTSIKLLYGEVTYTYSNEVRWHNDHIGHLEVLVRANSRDSRNLHL